ncbi:hypothetical protein HZS_7809, partial [Henneguya salminicola]
MIIYQILLNLILYYYLVPKIKSQQQDCKLDIGFALDESRSIYYKHFDDMKEFAAKFIEQLNTGSDRAHTFLLTFAENTREIWSFDDPASIDKDSALSLLKNVKQSEEPLTCIERTLKRVRDVMFTSEKIRPDVTKILVLVSDGNGNCVISKDLIAEAQTLKDQGIEIITIAVGNQIDENELIAISSRPESFFHIANFEQLIASVPVFFDKACELQKNKMLKPVISVEKIDSSEVQEHMIDKQYDFGFLIEISSLITHDTFEIMKKIPEIAMNMLQPSAQGSRISVMFFSETVIHLVKFNDPESYDMDLMKRKISGVTLSTSSRSCSNIALEHVVSNMFNDPSRTQITKILVIALSSPNNCVEPEKIWSTGQKVKSLGIVNFVISFGDRIDRIELLGIASGGSNIFHIEFPSQIEIYIRSIIERSLYYSRSGFFTSLSVYQSNTIQFTIISKRIDLAIMFENTASIQDEEFDAIKAILISLIKAADSSKTQSRVAIGSFGNDYNIYWDINNPISTDTQAALARVNEIQKSTDSKYCIEKGLQAVEESIFTENNKRETDARFMILIAIHSGNCQDVGYARRLAMKLKSRNIYSLTIGYGSQTSVNELTFISQKTGYFWQIYSIRQVFAIVNIISNVIVENSQINTNRMRQRNTAPTDVEAVDLGFIITGCGSVTAIDFKKLITTVISTVSQLRVGLDASRISVMLDGKYPKLLWEFDDIKATDIGSLKSFLTRYPKPTESGGCLDISLEKAELEMFNIENQRPKVHRILIILAADTSLCNEMEIFTTVIERFKYDGTYIIAVGMGSRINQNILRMAVTKDKFYFYYTLVGIYKIRITALIKYIIQNELGVEIEEEYEITTPAAVTIPIVFSTPSPNSICEVYLGFMIDESMSTTPQEFDTSKEIIIKIIEELKPKQDQAHTALMLMSAQGRGIYNFTDLEGYSLVGARSKIRRMEQSKNPFTCFGNSLEQVYSEMFAIDNIPSGVYKALLIMSDGMENCGSRELYDLTDMSSRLKNHGVVIYTIRVGASTEEMHLKKIASSATDTYFSINNYAAFYSSMGDFIQNVCKKNKYVPPTHPYMDHEKKKEHCNTRLLFQLDDSLNNQDYNELLGNVEEMIKYVMERVNADTSSITSQTAVITYSNEATSIYTFTSEEADDSARALIRLRNSRNNPLVESVSCLSKSLEYAAERIFKIPQRHSMSVDVTLIIGRATKECNDEDKIIYFSKELKKRGVKILAAMIGGVDVDYSLYMEIVSLNIFFYNLRSISHLRTMEYFWINQVCRIYPERSALILTTPKPSIPDVPDVEEEIDSCNSRLLIVLDESSLSPAEYSIIVKASDDLIVRFMSRINKDTQRVTSLTSLISYSENAEKVWGFDSTEAKNYKIAQSTLKNRPHVISDKSCNEKALHMALTDIFQTPSADSTSSFVIVLITSNSNTCGNMPLANYYAQQLMRKNIDIMVVTVGFSKALDEIRSIVSSTNLFIERAIYSDIIKINNYITEVVCRLIPKNNVPEKTRTTTPSIIFAHTTTPRPILPQPEEKASCNSRLLIITDESSISQSDFFILQAAVENILTKFMHRINDDVRTVTSSSSFITYAENALKLWGFESIEGRNYEASLRKLKAHNRIISDLSCNEKALELASKDIFQNPNLDSTSSNVILLITSNSNNCGKFHLAEHYSKLIKQDNIEILIVSVGYSQSLEELKSLLSHQNFFITRAQYSELIPITDYLVELVCRIPPDTKIPTSTTRKFVSTSTTPFYPIKRSTPSIETTPNVRTTPPIKTNPYVRTTPPIKTTPYVRTTPPIKTTPYVQTTPLIETTPSIKTTPYVRTTPLIETTPNIKTTLPIKTTPYIQTTLPIKTTPYIKTTTPIQTTPYIKTTPHHPPILTTIRPPPKQTTQRPPPKQTTQRPPPKQTTQRPPPKQ